MSNKDDTIKLLKMISSRLLPYDICTEDQHITLTDKELERAGFDYDHALLILKNCFMDAGISSGKNIDKKNEIQKDISLLVDSRQIDNYLFSLMYSNEEEYQVPDLSKSFYLNINTGAFSFNGTQGTLSPKSREFNFLKILYSSSTHQATYEELLNRKEKATANDKNMLTEIVKTLKRKLFILPKTDFSNKDIIINISKYGYKIDI